jgi:iron(II)-dependent oxidoreductase
MTQAQRKRDLRAALEAVRKRTLRLLDHVPDAFLKVRVHDFYSPVGWHFGHVGRTEEFWACKEALGGSCLDDRLSFLFADLPENPKDNRVHLPSREEIVEYLAQTRRRALAALDSADLDSDSPLLAEGYAWEFARQHESQHQETITELLQLIHKQIGRGESAGSAGWPPDARPTEMVSLPGGAFMMGSDDPHGYDNEKRAHEVTVAPFALDRTPVTAAQWLAFIQDGGYRRPELWTPEGWAWRRRENAERPEYWQSGGAACFGLMGLRAIDPREPVSGINWYEADAYARSVGKRLPTEAEWEYAAAHDPISDRARRYPWGDEPPTNERAACGLLAWSPAPVGGKPAGASALGLLDMAGGVWEWTATPFLPYPGFQAFPYDGYSKEHMNGGHYVCRGGSWATSDPILRCSFRNWYVPTYRQGFLGLRCAR